MSNINTVVTFIKMFSNLKDGESLTLGQAVGLGHELLRGYISTDNKYTEVISNDYDGIDALAQHGHWDLAESGMSMNPIPGVCYGGSFSVVTKQQFDQFSQAYPELNEHTDKMRNAIIYNIDGMVEFFNELLQKHKILTPAMVEYYVVFLIGHERGHWDQSIELYKPIEGAAEAIMSSENATIEQVLTYYSQTHEIDADLRAFDFVREVLDINLYNNPVHMDEVILKCA